MKLNPFSKKNSNGYYDKVKAEHDQLARDIAAKRAELEEAQADHEHKQRRYHELAQQGSMYSSTKEEKHAHLEASAAYNRIGAIKSEIGLLESRIAPLRRIVSAPERFTKTKQQLAALIAQRQAHTAEIEVVDKQIAKLNQRIADLEARVAAETKSASRTLLDGEGEFVVPESLTRLEVELRIARASLAELQVQREAASAQLRELPSAIREARRNFIHYRADVAEIELYEQLMPVMHAVARASAARREISVRHDESRFEIEIPRELVASAQAALVAELSED